MIWISLILELSIWTDWMIEEVDLVEWSFVVDVTWEEEEEEEILEPELWVVAASLENLTTDTEVEEIGEDFEV